MIFGGIKYIQFTEKTLTAVSFREIFFSKRRDTIARSGERCATSKRPDFPLSLPARDHFANPSEFIVSDSATSDVVVGKIIWRNRVAYLRTPEFTGRRKSAPRRRTRHRRINKFVPSQLGADSSRLALVSRLLVCLSSAQIKNV